MFNPIMFNFATTPLSEQKRLTGLHRQRLVTIAESQTLIEQERERSARRRREWLANTAAMEARAEAHRLAQAQIDQRIASLRLA